VIDSCAKPSAAFFTFTRRTALAVVDAVASADTTSSTPAVVGAYEEPAERTAVEYAAFPVLEADAIPDTTILISVYVGVPALFLSAAPTAVEVAQGVAITVTTYVPAVSAMFVRVAAPTEEVSRITL